MEKQVNDKRLHVIISAADWKWLQSEAIIYRATPSWVVRRLIDQARTQKQGKNEH